MPGPAPKKHLIYFEVNHQGYAIEAAELAGVATGCPFVAYPGLPERVIGLVQWSGKVFPVVDVFNNPGANLHTSTILFSTEGVGGPFAEIAIAVPGAVRVFFAETSAPPPEEANELILATLADSEGHNALQLSLPKIAESLPRPALARSDHGGKKIAA